MAELARKPAPASPRSGTAQRVQPPVAAPALAKTNPDPADQEESAMNPILQTLLEKVESLSTRVEFLSSKVEAISARVEAISAKVGDLALNFEKLRADFANHLAKSADRDRVLSERISKVETRVADRDKEMIKWFVGIAFALFLANAAAMGLLLEYHNSAPAVYYASPPAVYYAPPAASVLPAPG